MSADEAEVRPRPLRDAYAAFFQEQPWSHAVTLTFRNDLSRERAKAEFIRFKRDLERRSQSAVGWYMAIEDTYAGRPHVHAILRVDGLTPEDVADAWQKGRSEVEDYDPTRGWCLYMSKSLEGGDPDYDFAGLIKKAA